MPANLYGWLKRMLPCKQEYFKHIFGWFYFYERCMNFAKDLFINKLLSSLSKDATLMNFPYSDIAQNMSFNPPPFFLMGTVWIVTIIWQFFSAAAASLLCFRQDNRSAGGGNLIPTSFRDICTRPLVFWWNKFLHYLLFQIPQKYKK